MLFHSTEFLIFFAAFVLLYWLARKDIRWRNRLVVAASYLFYGWWDWRLLGLLAATSLVDFGVGIALGRTGDDRVRRRWLGVSLGVNLGVLGLFKYLGFFVDSFHALLGTLGFEEPSRTWHLLLPVGISFYTFQALSYAVDVYRRRITPTRDLAAFLAYISFFPQLVAGPIERATHLLPQFLSPRVIRPSDLEEGLWLVLWGLFKKVVVADHLAGYAELAFDRGIDSGPLVLLGVVAFAGQIYGDFSGYSDVARGLARLLGFDLSPNFELPYFATQVRDFWRRWHISLSTWLRDYLYLPLGGSRAGEGRTRWNLSATMLLGGLWHGAAWNFVLWGAWHGLALVVQREWSRRARLPRIAAWFLTLSTVGYGWLLFRAGSMERVVELHRALVSWRSPDWLGPFAVGVAAWWLPLALVQCWQWRRRNLLAPLRAPVWQRCLLQGTLLAALLAFWERETVPFLYFQF
jgi:D-alanyl-lipoteichoic acid acyltransferase DltB (MBOAT superfamily)